MCTDQNPRMQRGVSLIELIIFIIIISVGLTGILLVMNQTTAHSADPLIHKQAIAVAESLLEEIQLQDYTDANSGLATCPASAVTVTNRSTNYHIIDCYKAFNMPSPPGIYSLNDGTTPIAGLTGYAANVAIVDAVLGGVASAVRITVTVTDPQGTQIAIDGYRTAY